MSDKRFVIKSTATELELYDDDVQIGEFPHFEWVAKSVDSVVDLLNEQQDTIKHLEEYSGDLEYDNKTLSEENKQLKKRLEKINGGYGHLTHYKGLTANEWLIQGQERELKKKDKQISEWIEQHSKDIVKIGEQNKLIQKLKEENEQLKTEVEHLKHQCKDLSEENGFLRFEVSHYEHQCKKLLEYGVKNE